MPTMRQTQGTIPILDLLSVTHRALQLSRLFLRYAHTAFLLFSPKNTSLGRLPLVARSNISPFTKSTSGMSIFKNSPARRPVSSRAKNIARSRSPKNVHLLQVSSIFRRSSKLTSSSGSYSTFGALTFRIGFFPALGFGLILPPIQEGT